LLFPLPPKRLIQLTCVNIINGHFQLFRFSSILFNFLIIISVNRLFNNTIVTIILAKNDNILIFIDGLISFTIHPPNHQNN